MSRMAQVQRALGAHYGEDIAEHICSGNALRVLRTQWGRKRSRPTVP